VLVASTANSAFKNAAQRFKASRGRAARHHLAAPAVEGSLALDLVFLILSSLSAMVA
jgi:hypothetical protein